MCAPQAVKPLPATDGKKVKGAAKAEKGPKVKAAKSAYIYFTSDKRAEVKGAARSLLYEIDMHASQEGPHAVALHLHCLQCQD